MYIINTYEYIELQHPGIENFLKESKNDIAVILNFDILHRPR